MDPITHGLLGAVTKNLGFKRRFALLTLVLASVAPDIDYITKLFGDEYFLRHHRGITHGLPAVAAVSVLVLVLVGPRRGGFYYAFLTAIGYGAHILLDVTNQYGVRLFAPLDYQMYSLDLTFLLDPYVSVGLLAGLALARFARDKKRTVALATLLLLVFYIGIRQHFHDKTMEFLRSTRKHYIVQSMSPMPNDFLRWWFVARNEDRVDVGFADLFTKRVCVHKSYPLNYTNKAVARSMVADMTKSFLYFSRQPYAEVRHENGRTVVLWRELSYAYAPGDHFVVRVVLDGNGKILDASFRL